MSVIVRILVGALVFLSVPFWFPILAFGSMLYDVGRAILDDPDSL
jgi:hypothetical protein